jgi:hypothetical protein
MLVVFVLTEERDSVLGFIGILLWHVEIIDELK